MTGMDVALFFREIPSKIKSRFISTGCPVSKLPLEVFVQDIVLPYLGIEDVIRLRRVSKFFVVVTCQAIIWKRFLRGMTMPVPFLRPSFPYHMSCYDFEVEHYVTRAVSCDDNWRRPKPRAYTGHPILMGAEVLEVKLLPGSKFYVAALKDPGVRRYYIAVYNMETPQGVSAIPLACFETHSSAFKIQAKYMTYDGKPGIMILYLQRYFLDPAQASPNEFDPGMFRYHQNDMNEFDWSIPMEHSISCLFMDLEYVERLASPECPPGSWNYLAALRRTPAPPFIDVFTLRSTYPFKEPELFIMDGKPYAAMIQKPEQILLIVDLDAGAWHRVVPPRDPGVSYHTETFRVLPYQHEVFVIRTVLSRDLPRRDPESAFKLEFLLMDIRNRNVDPNTQCHDVRQRIDQPMLNREWHIPDINDLCPQGGDIAEESHPALRTRNIPPAIPVFGIQDRHIFMLQVFPSRIFFGSEYFWRYDLVDRVTMQTCHTGNNTMHLIPGMERSVCWDTDRDSIRTNAAAIGVWRFVNLRKHPPEEYPDPTADLEKEDFLETGRLPMPKIPFALLPLPTDLEAGLLKKGIDNMAYDESIGRVCIVAGNDTTKMTVLDYGCGRYRNGL